MTISQSTHSTLRNLTTQFVQNGTLEAIYLRPARGIPCLQVSTTIALAESGLQGDRISLVKLPNPSGSNRQVTLLQAEHIAVIAQFLGKPIDAALLRRNLIVSGINLLAAKSLLRDQTVQLKIGEVVLEITGPCEPCYKMEAALGKGAYNAMRGHGGVNAKVITSGKLSLSDAVTCHIVEPTITTAQSSLF